MKDYHTVTNWLENRDKIISIPPKDANQMKTLKKKVKVSSIQNFLKILVIGTNQK